MKAATFDIHTSPALQSLTSAQPEIPVDICSSVVGLDGTGGDLVDVRQSSERELGITIGDVTGHGQDAWPFAAQVRDVLDELDESDRNNRLWLSDLNTRLVRRLDEDHFCAAISVRVQWSPSADDVDVNLAIAGMPSPVVVRHDGSRDWLTAGNLPLGVEEDELFLPSTITCKLRPGDKLVIFSDGISEAHGPSRELFGAAGIERVVQNLAPAAASDVLRGILSAVGRHLAGHQAHDDMSVVIIENTHHRRVANRHAA